MISDTPVNVQAGFLTFIVIVLVLLVYFVFISAINYFSVNKFKRNFKSENEAIEFLKNTGVSLGQELGFLRVKHDYIFASLLLDLYAKNVINITSVKVEYTKDNEFVKVDAELKRSKRSKVYDTHALKLDRKSIVTCNPKEQELVNIIFKNKDEITLIEITNKRMAMRANIIVFINRLYLNAKSRKSGLFSWYIGGDIKKPKIYKFGGFGLVVFGALSVAVPMVGLFLVFNTTKIEEGTAIADTAFNISAFCFAAMLIFSSIAVVPALSLSFPLGTKFSVSKLGKYTDDGAKIRAALYVIQNNISNESFLDSTILPFAISFTPFKKMLKQAGKKNAKKLTYNDINLYSFLFDVGGLTGLFIDHQDSIPTRYYFATEYANDDEETASAWFHYGELMMAERNNLTQFYNR